MRQSTLALPPDVFRVISTEKEPGQASLSVTASLQPEHVELALALAFAHDHEQVMEREIRVPMHSVLVGGERVFEAYFLPREDSPFPSIAHCLGHGPSPAAAAEDLMTSLSKVFFPPLGTDGPT